LPTEVADTEGVRMEAEMFVQYEALRSETYKLLADCYYPPDEALSSKIVDLVENLELVRLEAQQDISWGGRKILKADNMEELKVEYARLFAGPYTLLAPPYGSVYLEPERRIMGNSTMDVVNRYRQSGLVVAEDFKDAPDHIAAELEFMHFMIFKEMEANNQGDINSLITWLLNRRSFLDDHLGAWVSEFAGKVVENAKTTFYQNLARTTEAIISDDYHTISSALNSWASNSEKSVEREPLSGQG
jgi:putative dimethyl sulfoxide reductase chaperone